MDIVYKVSISEDGKNSMIRTIENETVELEVPAYGITAVLIGH